MKSTITKKAPDGRILEITESEGNAQQNSTEINKNAKGEMSWKIKVYNDDPNQMEKELQTYKEIAERKTRAAGSP